MEETAGNPETLVVEEQQIEDKVFGTSDNFFETLEQDVNGSITDDNTEATQQADGTEQVTHLENVGSDNVGWDDDGNPYKKRYQDSSREAVKLRDQYKEVEPFVPVLEAMKNDSGLVEHVREYLVNGGNTPKSIQEELKLDEDFIFDSQDAMSDPDSDSAKVLNAQVDKVVQKRVGQIVTAEKQNAQKAQIEAQRRAQENDFKEKRGMTDEQFNSFKERAKGHILTLDDIDYLLNRDQANANVVQSTKNDMLNQMKNVRNIPTSASGANSQAEEKTPDNAIFDGILGLDGELDNLFG
jgi:transcriptional regulator with PAS, ATPase and Fis domain